MNLKRTKIKSLLSSQEEGRAVWVKGWVKTKRTGKNVIFIALNDGSAIHNIQIVADADKYGEEDLKEVTTGASISVQGTLTASQGSGQAMEIRLESLEIIGVADPDKFPLQPKRHSLEFLREIAHLRPRTNTIGAVLRVRHNLAFAIHKFFHEKGFYYLHTPILTASDAEGAGETFRVTALDLDNIPLNSAGKPDYTKDFFGRQTNLTVSGQLEGELTALALGEIYTFGPTFRAENSNTTRHLSEFWMVEPEMAFYDLTDSMALAEEMLKYLLGFVLENCRDDLRFLDERERNEEKAKPQHERHERSLSERLRFITACDFERLTYTEAVDILKHSRPNRKRKFRFPIQEWGADLRSEHERYLVEKHFKKPVIVYDYPKDIKAFYMRRNDDGKTVAAMDVLFPGIGEIVGGSQREERPDMLTSRMAEMHISEKELWWYLDTRRFGTAPHSGYGLGFERMMQFVSGMNNIRDVIPFPRTPGNCDF